MPNIVLGIASCSTCSMKKSKVDGKVPCFCKLCNGKLVSRYLRRKHKQAYTGVSSIPPSIQSIHSTTEDIQSVQVLQPLQTEIVKHTNSPIPQETQECELQSNDEQTSPPGEDCITEDSQSSDDRLVCS